MIATMDWNTFFSALTAMLIIVVPLLTTQIVQIILAVYKARSDRLAQEKAAAAVSEVKQTAAASAATINTLVSSVAEVHKLTNGMSERLQAVSHAQGMSDQRDADRK